MEQVCQEEKNTIVEETSSVNKIIQSCMELRDNFLVLDVLEKKTSMLRDITSKLLE